MGQYRTGTVSVTNGNATVTVTGASTGAEAIAAGDAFKVDRDNETVYSISARTPASGPSITSLTISPVYGGTTGSGLNYQITQDFTPNRSYPEFAQGDQDAADWLTKALRMIDTDLAAILGSGSSLGLLANQIAFWNAGLKGSANLTWNGTSFVIGTAGPHGIGGGTQPRTGLLIAGSFTPTSTLEGGAVSIESTINVPANQSGYIFSIGGTANPTLNKAASGTHSDFVFLRIVGPFIGAGDATLTNSSSLKIAPPTGAVGTNNYSLWVNGGSIRVDAAGPHALGGNLFAGAGLYLTGTFAGTLGTACRGVQLDQTLTPAVGLDAVGLYVNPSFTENSSGTHSQLLGAFFTVQGVNAGAAAVTTIATVRIDPPPGIGTQIYSLWVSGGTTRLAGDLYLSVSGAAVTYRGNLGGAGLRFLTMTDDAGGGGVERMRLTESGILALGTTTVTGVAAGEIVVANAKGYHFVSAGGSGANYRVASDAGDNLLYDVPTASDSHAFEWAGVNDFTIVKENSGAALLFNSESSADHAAPGANAAKLYTKDNGSGKTQVVARFNTGAVQVLATEP